MTIFDVRDIVSYEEFILFVLNKSIFFKTNKNKIFEKYNVLKADSWEENLDKYQNFYKEYETLILKITEESVSFYKDLFLQKTELNLNTDFNHTRFFDESEIRKYKCIKELINYSVFKIFGQNIEHIHKEKLHYPQVSILAKEDNFCRLLFDGFKIDYNRNAENFAKVENFCNRNFLLHIDKEKYNTQKLLG